jgi:hypothetical protein
VSKEHTVRRATLAVLVSFALFSQAASLRADPPEQLKTFDAFLRALEAGRSVRAVIHYARCRLVIDGKDEKAPDAVGGMDFRTFEYFAAGSIGNPRGFVSTSETVLISHPRYGYVQNYVKVRVYEDHAVEITARYLEPKTLKIVMDETFYGTIDDGRNGGGVALFAAGLPGPPA